MDFVEIIPSVRKYEWGRRERGALTRVFYGNARVAGSDQGRSVLEGEVENGNYVNRERLSECRDDGLKGKEAVVASLGGGLGGFLGPDGEEEPYAELWYGSHVSSPSGVVFNGRFLEKMTLDDVISSEFGLEGPTRLPFLLKVLSISKPLSLQVHPDQVLAGKLHRSFPMIYPDDSHKPEIAIALTEFEAFCGFRDTLQILSLLQSFPETLVIFGVSRDFITQTIQTHKKDDTLVPPDHTKPDPLCSIKKDLFINMLNSKPETTRAALDSLVQRLQLTSSSSLDDYTDQRRSDTALIESLILRLHSHFPLDIGIICPILLHYYKLNPGDALYIGAGTIHSYLSGECIECMANSDNVVRCGLTPKLKDVPTLLQAVNFQLNNAKIFLHHTSFQEMSSTPLLIDYLVETVDEFHVQILSLHPQDHSSSSQTSQEQSGTSFSAPESSPYSLLLCISGGCHLSITSPSSQVSRNIHSILQGRAILVKPGTKISFSPLPSSSCTNSPTRFALVTLPKHKL
ncbi:mannose-6-phosphate isomerase [Cryptosporidium canis]|uniref:mannose-6-phosphate isomerase n=1 Tax=Cryptosporidium canis TaxID=195482 RepID=A0ABQ8P9R2_9CRYT|nr:mannose-6-phosphate isomerase [Cryptosporidium canis]KAJ1614992.1 mannose-6-phosphate isomerase [Cryptosporidium canis]